MLNVILKMTNACNLRCKYCSLGKKEDFRFICEDTLKKTIDFIVGIAEKKAFKEISVIFHGGEPTLFDKCFYEEIIDYANKYGNLNFFWKMQSNGFHFKNDFINFLADKKVALGISIDGNEKNHNTYRIDTLGNGTYDKIKQNILTLKKNNINCSCLMVVNHNLLSERLDFIDWFNYNGIPLKINPLIDCGEVYGEKTMILRKGDYANYIIEVFKYILLKEIEISIQPIEEIFKSAIGIGKNHECTFSSDCYKSFLCIDYNGDIYPCGRFSDMQIYKIGNIFNENYDIFDSDNFIALKMFHRRINEQCGNCDYKIYCNGGCAAIRALESDLKNPLCEDYKKMIDFFQKEGIKLYKSYLLDKKQRLLHRLDRQEQ